MNVSSEIIHILNCRNTPGTSMTNEIYKLINREFRSLNKKQKRYLELIIGMLCMFALEVRDE